MRIDQLVPSFASQDATGALASAIRHSLGELGHESVIYAGEVVSITDESDPVAPVGEMDGKAELIIYHLGIGSPLVDLFLAEPSKRAVLYHNITPPRFFEGWDPPVVEAVRRGYADLERCAAVATLGIGVSEYNRDALRRAGFAKTELLPIPVEPPALTQPMQTPLAQQLAERRKGGRIWLFVGRFVPNKCQADVVRAFAAYRRAVDPQATLLLVGSRFTGSYQDAVMELAGQIGVGDAVIAPGAVSEGDLASCYQAADVFVCLSEHEGFCVPLVEAMHHQLPVVAYAAGAVPETLGGAGVLLSEKDPVLVAAATHLVMESQPLRSELVTRGKSRAGEFGSAQLRQGLVRVIERAFC